LLSSKFPFFFFFFFFRAGMFRVGCCGPIRARTTSRVKSDAFFDFGCVPGTIGSPARPSLKTTGDRRGFPIWSFKVAQSFSCGRPGRPATRECSRFWWITGAISNWHLAGAGGNGACERTEQDAAAGTLRTAIQARGSGAGLTWEISLGFCRARRPTITPIIPFISGVPATEEAVRQVQLSSAQPRSASRIEGTAAASQKIAQETAGSALLIRASAHRVSRVMSFRPPRRTTPLGKWK